MQRNHPSCNQISAQVTEEIYEAMPDDDDPPAQVPPRGGKAAKPASGPKTGRGNSFQSLMQQLSPAGNSRPDDDAIVDDLDDDGLPRPATAGKKAPPPAKTGKAAKSSIKKTTPAAGKNASSQEITAYGMTSTDDEAPPPAYVRGMHGCWEHECRY